MTHKRQQSQPAAKSCRGEIEQAIAGKQCPLCGGSNRCALEEGLAIDSCWCRQSSFPSALLSKVPPELRSCICERCVQRFRLGHTFT